jgi:tetratricopeptide (TPR) repeat protein
VLHLSGRVQDSIRILRQTQQIDPLSLAISTQLQFALDAAGNVEEVQAEYARSLDLTGNHQRVYWLAYLRMIAEPDPDPVAVRDHYEKMLESANLRMKLLQDLGDAGVDKRAARDALRVALEEAGNQDPLRLLVISHASDAFGDRDVAIDAQGRILKMDSTPQTIWGIWRSGVRTDPRFKQQLRDSGLVDYWRATGNWGDFCKPVGTDDFECR